MNPKLTTILMLTLSIFLSACATAQPVNTATPLPSETPEPTATATMTLIPSPTPLPPTPEYQGELTYDPDTQSLQDAEGTAIFKLDSSGEWVRIVPEAIRDTVEYIEEVWQAEATWELVAFEGDEVYTVAIESGEWVYARKDGSMFLEVGGLTFEIKEVGIFEGESRAYYPGQQGDGQRWLRWNPETKNYEEVAFSGWDWENFQRPLVRDFLVQFGVITEADIEGLEGEELDVVLQAGLEEVWEEFLSLREAESSVVGERRLGSLRTGSGCTKSECYAKVWMDGVNLPLGVVNLERGGRYGEEIGGEEYVYVAREGDEMVVAPLYNGETFTDPETGEILGLIPRVVGAELDSEWVEFGGSQKLVGKVGEYYDREEPQFESVEDLMQRVNVDEAPDELFINARYKGKKGWSFVGYMNINSYIMFGTKDIDSWSMVELLKFGNIYDSISVETGDPWINEAFFPFIAGSGFREISVGHDRYVKELKGVERLRAVLEAYRDDVGVFVENL